MSPREQANGDTVVPSNPDAILFRLLARRGIAKNWARSADPKLGVQAECSSLAHDTTFMSKFETYITANEIIRQSCVSMLAQLALVAGVRWQDTAPILQPLSQRGWHIGRWLPTFLLIDGPLGRLLKDVDSPLTDVLRTRYSELPLLADTRDAFNNDTFRLVRNGFAHWSFDWIIHGGHQSVRIVDWNTGEETARLSLLECEALHFLTASAVHAIDRKLFAILSRQQVVG